MIALFLAAALATEPVVEIGVVVGGTPGDVINEVGFGGRLGIRPLPALSFDLLVSGSPNLGRAQWTRGMRRVVELNLISPNIVRTTMLLEFRPTLLPVRAVTPTRGEPIKTEVYVAPGAMALRVKEEWLPRPEPAFWEGGLSLNVGTRVVFGRTILHAELAQRNQWRSNPNRFSAHRLVSNFALNTGVSVALGKKD